MDPSRILSELCSAVQVQPHNATQALLQTKVHGYLCYRTDNNRVLCYSAEERGWNYDVWCCLKIARNELPMTLFANCRRNQERNIVSGSIKISSSFSRQFRKFDPRPWVNFYRNVTILIWYSLTVCRYHRSLNKFGIYTISWTLIFYLMNGERQ